MNKIPSKPCHFTCRFDSMCCTVHIVVNCEVGPCRTRPRSGYATEAECARDIHSWGEPERAPHDQSNGDRVCLSVHLSVCPSVHRMFTFRIYVCSNLTQMCNISLVQRACYSASTIVRVQFTERGQATAKT